MTYKSFTTLDDLFELLVQRFWIQPPDNLKPKEFEEWTKLKQHIIQMRYGHPFVLAFASPILPLTRSLRFTL
jgi:son of sevenless-like protein